jgi:drug/metabolite transporter (DMT)-like permease
VACGVFLDNDAPVFLCKRPQLREIRATRAELSLLPAPHQLHLSPIKHSAAAVCYDSARFWSQRRCRRRMTAPALPTVPQSMAPRPRFLDLTAIAICTLAWGTTWYVITFQLGAVDPVVSLAYRFALATALLFSWCVVRGLPLRLSLAQHTSACGIGLFTFGIDYTFIYLAEARISSAVVAVTFATLALVNLAVFRVVFGQRAPLRAWMGAGLGAAGVAVLSWSEIANAHLDARARAGFGMASVAIVSAAVGNVFARRGEAAGASVAALTAWAMVYGTLVLALYALVMQRPWVFEPSLAYAASLVYLALVGSVVAFLFYYALARRRGYAAASYVTALTPAVAMTVSSLFEGKKWSATALAGFVLVLIGQWLLLRARRGG